MQTFKLNQSENLDEKQYYVLEYIFHNGKSNYIYNEDKSINWSYIEQKSKRYSENEIVDYLKSDQFEENVNIYSENEIVIESYDEEYKETFDSYISAFAYLSKDRMIFQDDRFYLTELTAKIDDSNIEFCLSKRRLNESEEIVTKYNLNIISYDFTSVENEDEFDTLVEDSVDEIVEFIEEFNEDETRYNISRSELIVYVTSAANI